MCSSWGDLAHELATFVCGMTNRKSENSSKSEVEVVKNDVIGKT